MTMPLIPRRNKEEAVIDLLTSIALEETALASLIEAEAKIVQSISMAEPNSPEVIAFQEALTKIIKVVAKIQMLLLCKLETVGDILKPRPQPKPKLACIKTEKIYESCRKEQVNKKTINLSHIAVGKVSSVTCKDVELVIDDSFPFVCKKNMGTNHARVSFYYRFRFQFTDEEGAKIFTSEPAIHYSRVKMSERIKEKGLTVKCDVFLECLECFVSGYQEVTCCIGKLLVFSLTAVVQIMVYEHGFCPKPDLCSEVEHKCPDFTPSLNIALQSKESCDK